MRKLYLIPALLLSIAFITACSSPILDDVEGGNPSTLAEENKDIVSLSFVYDEIGEFSGGYAVARIENETGIINSNMEKIESLWDMSILDYKNGYFILEAEKGYQCYKIDSAEVTYSVELTNQDFYFDSAAIENSGFTVSANDVYGTMDFEGQLVFKDESVAFSHFLENGRVVISKESQGQWKHGGVAAFDGTILVEPAYDKILRTSEGYTQVQKEDKYGYVDEDFTLVIDPLYDYGRDFSQGLVFVSSGVKGIQYLDKEGKIVINRPDGYYNPYIVSTQPLHDFDEGIAVIYKELISYSADYDTLTNPDKYTPYFAWTFTCDYIDLEGNILYSYNTPIKVDYFFTMWNDPVQRDKGKGIINLDYEAYSPHTMCEDLEIEWTITKDGVEYIAKEEDQIEVRNFFNGADFVDKESDMPQYIRAK